MATTVLNSVMDMFDSDGLSSLAGRLGTSESAVSSGIASSIAAMLGGLARNANDPASLNQIFDLVDHSREDVSVSSLASAAFSPAGGASAMSPVIETGKRFLSMIFRDKEASVNDAVARQSGLGGGVVPQLLGMLAPILLSVLSRRVHEGHLNPSSFRSELLGEASSLKHLIPAGLASLFSDTSAAVASGAHETKEAVRKSAGWMWPAILAALVLFAIIWAFRGSSAPDVSTTASSVGSAVKSGIASLGDFVHRTLPGNITLRIPEFGMEGRLLAFIQSNQNPSKETWFDFDRLVFDTNSATLRPESQEQLENIASILKAYPAVKVKIGGYTDNTGDAAANMTLSRARANSVMGELAKLGVASGRLEAEGYGSQHPVADNSTEEGRAKNRRISIRVTAL